VAEPAIVSEANDPPNVTVTPRRQDVAHEGTPPANHYPAPVSKTLLRIVRGPGSAGSRGR